MKSLVRPLLLRCPIRGRGIQQEHPARSSTLPTGLLINQWVRARRHKSYALPRLLPPAALSGQGDGGVAKVYRGCKWRKVRSTFATRNEQRSRK